MSGTEFPALEAAYAQLDPDRFSLVMYDGKYTH
jgi:hypothetical protein